MLQKLKAHIANPNIRTFIVCVAVAAIFLAVAVHLYRTRIGPNIDPEYVPNKEYTSGRRGAPTIFFFYTTWCPHCKTARPVWDKFKEEVKNKKIKGQELVFMEVDCDKEKGLADKYQVKGYPTIKLVNGDRVVEYDAKPSLPALHQFVETSL
jgi:thiol-disulfide isomerase/thioredoxin